MDLDTALLRAFVTTVEEHHFGRAAARLFITQQALSKRIARLEEILGVRLLDRTNRRVALTAAGERFLPPARDAVDAVDAAAAAAGIGGPLRVDVMDGDAAAIDLVRQAAARDPGLELEVTARGARRSAVEALRAGDVDVAFGRAFAQPWPDDVRRRCALLEPLALLVGEGHPLWPVPEVPMADLTRYRLRFPMHGAPEDWVGFVDALSAAFGLTIDRTGPDLGFDHLLDRTASSPDAATFYGLRMPPPRAGRLRVVPIVAPSPVFAWAVMWRRRVPESTVSRLIGPAPTALPPDVWLPEPDRSWLAAVSGGRAAR